LDQQSDLTTSIIFAREILKDVEMTEEQTKYLCTEAVRADIEGHRGDIYAAEVAKANAAFKRRTSVNARDLQLAVQLAILPRGRWMNTAEDDQAMPHPTTASPPPINNSLMNYRMRTPTRKNNRKNGRSPKLINLKHKLCPAFQGVQKP
jgi:magnesium chelatase subunit D